MKARRLIIAGMWLNLLAASATAETIVIRPDPCAAPADAPKIVLMGGVEAADLKPDRAAADHILVLYPVPARGWASARILARFAVEGAQQARRAPGC